MNSALFFDAADVWYQVAQLSALFAHPHLRVDLDHSFSASRHTEFGQAAPGVVTVQGGGNPTSRCTDTGILQIHARGAPTNRLSGVYATTY